MATFVLVHGAWHGGWCWWRVRAGLEAAGHTVHTPTLTGLGERAHLARPDIDLATHVQDVLGVLECEDLREVLLVGHSYGGMVITGVAERVPGRLAHLVYLDAFVPADGQSAFDLVPPFRALLRAQAQAQGDGWRIPPPAPDGPVLEVTKPGDIAWLRERLVSQPLLTMEQPVRLGNPLAAALPRTYVWCAGKALGADTAARLRTAPGWGYREFVSGHDAMITEPGALTQVLLSLTG